MISFTHTQHIQTVRQLSTSNSKRQPYEQTSGKVCQTTIKKAHMFSLKSRKTTATTTTQQTLFSRQFGYKTKLIICYQRTDEIIL
jgi:hypothetical protein